VEHVEQPSPEQVVWKAQIFWSHRTWESTIVEQVPGERIVWRSKGSKGHVDGAVTFHEIAPRLTRVMLVLEYYPQGLFERTGNLWRAQGRRARLELKHFCRHAMTETILNPDDAPGWHGEIRDGEVVDDGQGGEQEPADGETTDDVDDETDVDDTGSSEESDEDQPGDDEDAPPTDGDRPRRRRTAPRARRSATRTTAKTGGNRSGGRR
jgi:Polyketide cyclase / dehydrase and lipid transport